MKTGTKVAIGGGVLLTITLILFGIFGSEGQNTSFKPQEEFKLTPWINLPGPFDINRATFYLFLAAGLTVWTMVYIAGRMQERPNRVQTAVETAYTFMRDNIAGGNMPRDMARKWFSFVATLFLFIWFSEHDRLPAAADEHLGEDHHLRRAHPRAGPVRGDGEHLG